MGWGAKELSGDQSANTNVADSHEENRSMDISPGVSGDQVSNFNCSSKVFSKQTL